MRTEFPVLDVGCGERARADVNLDVRRTSACNLVASAENLPLRDSSVSLVLCSQVLEHLENPSMALREMKRVLLDGGEVRIDVPIPRFTNKMRWHLLRFFLNLPFTFRPREIEWLFHDIRSHPMAHKSIIDKKLIQRYFTVVKEENFAPILLTSLEGYFNKMLQRRGTKKQLNFSRLKAATLFICKK